MSASMRRRRRIASLIRGLRDIPRCCCIRMGLWSRGLWVWGGGDVGEMKMGTGQGRKGGRLLRGKGACGEGERMAKGPQKNRSSSFLSFGTGTTLKYLYQNLYILQPLTPLSILFHSIPFRPEKENSHQCRTHHNPPPLPTILPFHYLTFKTPITSV